MPEIPRDLSKEAKDFLKKCLVRDPKSPWTADLLLGHPFVSVAVADSVFTGSIEDERNRVFLPKTAKAVLNLTFSSHIQHQMHTLYLIVSWPQSTRLILFLRTLVNFLLTKRQKKLEVDVEQGLSGTSFQLDALGQYWAIQRIQLYQIHALIDF
ncbi:hypothetical protein TEA_019870 [Camellia sinensis var. sinensis]|uniref:Protein kinase domain-containing protein n=1 Tax=Camellia sinensis var. sinensis TaxID=542762 RepID=A0A4S4DDP8_CAMSN|nr:hypothetical protein TEA_019870 [Camellia sinensis var. sinensis]